MAVSFQQYPDERMTVVLIASQVDPASINIKNTLLEHTSWREIESVYDNPVYEHTEMQDIIIVTINDSKIHHENLDKEIEDQLNITLEHTVFLSRHRSKTGRPTLTIHPIGNYGDAQFGGKPKTLVKSSPRFMTHLLRLMKKHMQHTDLDYHVCYEVTHHGPYLKIPALFVEIGSTEKEWSQQEPANIIARSLIELLESYHYEEDLPDNIPVLLGIGGGHYAPRFTDVVFEKKAAFGHMIPSYHIDSGNIDRTMITQALEATPQVQAVYLHKKALKKSQVSDYKQWFQDQGIPVISSKELPSLE